MLPNKINRTARASYVAAFPLWTCLSLTCTTSVLADPVSWEGEISTGIEADGFRRGSVPVGFELEAETERSHHWQAGAKIRKNGKDPRMELIEAELERKNSTGSRFRLGLLKKKIGRAYEQSSRKRWALHRPVVYDKLETLSYIGYEPRIAYESADESWELSLGLPVSTNINSILRTTQTWSNHEIYQYVLVQTAKVPEDRLIAWAAALGYVWSATVASVEVETIAGQDIDHMIFLRAVGGGRERKFASGTTTINIPWGTIEDASWRSFFRLGAFVPDVAQENTQTHEAAAGLEYLEGPVRFSNAVHYVRNNSASKSGGVNIEDSYAAIKAIYYF
jgi:hypothetical protein